MSYKGKTIVYMRGYVLEETETSRYIIQTARLKRLP